MSNERLGIIEERRAARDAILSTARISPAARARIMGIPHHPTPAAKDTAPAAIPRRPDRALYKAPTLGATMVLNAVAEAYKVTAFALTSPLRDNRTAYARFAAALLLREKRKMHYSMIGRCLRRDHTTCIDAVLRAQQMLATDPEWAARYRAAEHTLDQQ